MCVNRLRNATRMSSLSKIRVLSGVKGTQGDPEELSPRTQNEINQIAGIRENEIWLPSLDTFRTFGTQLAM